MRKAWTFGMLGLACCLLGGRAAVADVRVNKEKIKESATLKVVSYNIWYCFNDKKELSAGSDWIKSCGADVLAIEEMCYADEPTFQRMAAEWGYPHAILLKPGTLSIGLCSKQPMTGVIRRVKGMYHGLIYAKIGDVNVVVTHLSPFKYEVRRQETKVIAELVGPMLKRHEKVIVMGDFNTPSPVDRDYVNGNQALLDLNLKLDKTHSSYVKNLLNGKFEFEAFQTLLDLPLFDAGTALGSEGGTVNTYPTVVGVPDPTERRGFSYRIDFILISENLKDRLKSFETVRDRVTDKLSDHYPIQAVFE